jgi:hypothetical protein
VDAIVDITSSFSSSTLHIPVHKISKSVEQVFDGEFSNNIIGQNCLYSKLKGQNLKLNFELLCLILFRI